MSCLEKMNPYSRTAPFLSKIKERTLLTGPGSSRRTYHIVLEIEGANFNFKVGDSVGVIPKNDLKMVDQILHQLGATGLEEIEDGRKRDKISFREFLLERANLSKVSFHKLFNVEKGATPLMELVERHKPCPHELCKILLPLMPRFYSIASSLKMYPDEIHLTVAFVNFEVSERLYSGVGSHFLCEQAILESTPIPIYLQPSNHFTLPEDPNAPIILIGPGTGIAPFRAFLQERLSKGAEGLNWLFFGERNRKTDFYYGPFWEELEKMGRIRLDTAFSRDQEKKIYVQHKMLEHKRSFWEWIEKGAFIYVCGDAEKMAKDVDLALHQIVREEGRQSDEEARKFLKTLRLEKRYLLDVY